MPVDNDLSGPRVMPMTMDPSRSQRHISRAMKELPGGYTGVCGVGRPTDDVEDAKKKAGREGNDTLDGYGGLWLSRR